MTRVRAIAAFLADRGQHNRALAFAAPGTPLDACTCSRCQRLYRRFPRDGWQLLLFPRAEIDHLNPSAGSGSRPVATPLPANPPTPARAGAIPRKPETVHA